MTNKTHELKIWPRFYVPLRNGKKMFEVRRNDRGFSPYDTLILREFDPQKQMYTGRTIKCEIGYIMAGYPLTNNYAILSLKDVLELPKGSYNGLANN